MPATTRRIATLAAAFAVALVASALLASPSLAQNPAQKPTPGKQATPTKPVATKPAAPAKPQPGTVAKPSAPEPPKTIAVERTPIVVPLLTAISAVDAEIYRRALELQDAGQFKAADEALTKLQDKLLMGHVLSQRYLHPAYAASYAELTAWLGDYNELQDAPKIYQLALKKRPANQPAPTPSSFVNPVQAGIAIVTPYYGPADRKLLSGNDLNQSLALKRQIAALLERDAHQQARKLIDGKDAERLLSPSEVARYRADLANRLLHVGQNDELALNVASDAAAGDDATLANWTAGVAAWRLGSYSESARRFEALAEAPNISTWTLAAASFWAARANLLAGNPEKYNPWMRRSASYPRTFYGILAQKTIGWAMGFRWQPTKLTSQYADLLRGERAGKRGLALLQVGEIDRAERELLGVSLGADPDLVSAVIALADEAKLPELALRVGQSVPDTADRERIVGLDTALYPIPHWQPKGGYIVDRALVYAFMRQESAFNPRVYSPVGAAGLMQLMPVTARAMANRAGTPDAANQVRDPGINIQLGQLYLQYLMDAPGIGDNLFMVAAAYNGGPGSVLRWQKQVDFNNDPLLYIASIPVRETRLFIERVVTNLWIYQMRMGQPTPTLDALAQHRWPSYKPIDAANPPKLSAAR